MQEMPPIRPNGASRRTSQRSAPVRPKKKSRKGVVFALIVFAVLTALIVIIAPKEPVSRATYTAGTEDGHVTSARNGISEAYQGLVISELMSSNRTAVPDENGFYADWVEVWNSTDHDIRMKDVGLSDRGDSIRFLFPDIILPPDGRVIVFCSDTNAAEPGRPFHAKFKLSSVGETVYLFDPNAYMIDSVTSPIMASDESWALMEDGSFATTAFFSPGYTNSEAGYQQYLTATMVSSGALIINEIMPDPITGLNDEDGELHDWIELYNTTDQPISLDNYALSDKENKPLKWRFPQGAVVAPKGYYVVFCSGKDRPGEVGGVPHTNFRLSAEHDTVILSDSHGRLVDRVVIDNIPEDCSYAREENGSFAIHQMATPGMPNDEASAAQMDFNLRAMNPVGVYISEVMASNDSTLVYQNDGYVDWVEIYNSSQSAVDLSGYGLSDNLGRPRRWQFPAGTMIGPGEYKVILCDGRADLNTTAQLHTSFKVKRAGGEVISLSTPEGRVLDKLILPLVPTNVSYGRTIGLSGFFYYDAPTPMAPNGNGFYGYAPEPELTLQPGLHYETVFTGFNVPENTRVYYTTDGSIPTANSTLYNGETIELNFTTVLRARAFSDEGLRPSNVVTGTYFINAYHNLPIVSLVCDPDELWNPDHGMLTVGPNVDKSGGIPFKNTIYRKFGKITREAHVEYYLLDGTQVLNQGLGIELSGAFSLDMPQKSMKVRAKSLYGAKTFQAALFDDRPYMEYKSFVLRNSGNDSAWTRLVDGFQSRLLDGYGTQVIHQAWNPVVVYLNGVYWGHMNMRERVDRFFVAQFEGLSFDDAKELTILQGDGTAKYGSNKEWTAMLKKIKAGNPAKNPEDLQYILDNIDVDNHLEYMALEMFLGNSDMGNTRYYKTNQPGAKWKWIFYDADYGMFRYAFDSPMSYTKAKGMGDQYIDNTVFLKLLSVPEYQDKFLRKLGDIFQTFTTEYMLSVLDPLVEQIQPEMGLHFARWAEEHDKAVIAEWPNTVDGAYRYWETRILRLKNIIKGRPYHLWGLVQTQFKLSDAQMMEYFGPRPELPADFNP